MRLLTMGLPERAKPILKTKLKYEPCEGVTRRPSARILEPGFVDSIIPTSPLRGTKFLPKRLVVMAAFFEPEAQQKSRAVSRARQL